MGMEAIHIGISATKLGLINNQHWPRRTGDFAEEPGRRTTKKRRCDWQRRLVQHRTMGISAFRIRSVFRNLISQGRLETVMVTMVISGSCRRSPFLVLDLLGFSEYRENSGYQPIIPHCGLQGLQSMAILRQEPSRRFTRGIHHQKRWGAVSNAWEGMQRNARDSFQLWPTNPIPQSQTSLQKTWFSREFIDVWDHLWGGDVKSSRKIPARLNWGMTISEADG